MNATQLTALRSLAYYPFTLQFTREFTKGTLLGLTHDDSLGFCVELDAEEWVSAVNANNRKGSVDYKVVSWKVVSA